MFRARKLKWQLSNQMFPIIAVIHQKDHLMRRQFTGVEVLLQPNHTTIAQIKQDRILRRT